jgi:lysyl-tRNA synthetase class 2
VRETTYRELFLDALGIDPLLADEATLRPALDGIRIDPEGLLRDDWLDLVLTHCIQPAFADDTIVLVHDYPASQCALARIRAGDPPVAERFELYLGRFELANGYHELVDAAEQRARFERDVARRVSRHAACPPIDERLLAALDHGLPDCAGVAMGMDRLLGVLMDADDLASTFAFPFDRA